MYGYIYKRENMINHKIYIGKHKYSLPQLDESYKGSGKLLLRAIKKYGEDNFSYELIDTACSLEYLNELEKHYIKVFDCVFPKGYNISNGGDGGDTLTNLPEEEKLARIEKSKKNRRKTILIHKGAAQKFVEREELKKYLNEGYEIGTTLETREKHRQRKLKFLEEHPEKRINKGTFKKGHTPWNFGIPMREESRQKLRESNLGKKQSPETIVKRTAKLNKLRAQGWNPFMGSKPANKGVTGVYMWVTDGEHNIHLKVTDNIPEGYYKGRTLHHPAWNKGIPNMKLKNTVWVCNDSERKQVPSNELSEWLSLGYQKGMKFKL